MNLHRSTLQPCLRLLSALVLTVVWGDLGPVSAAPRGAVQGPTISGLVADGDGQPLAGATVSLAPVMDSFQAYELRLRRGRMWAEPAASVLTSAEGRYAFVVEGRRKWRLIVEHPERVTVTRRLEPLFHDRELPVAKLYRARLLEVRVQAGGVALPGARVMAHSTSAGPDGWPQSWVAAVTDPSGNARLWLPRRGPWALQVAAKGLPSKHVVHDSGSVARVELTAGSRIDLSLRLASGKAAAGAVVFLPNTGLTLVRANRRGRVALYGEPGTRQAIELLNAEGASLQAEVEFPANPAANGQQRGRRELELEPPIRLDLQVVAAGSLHPVVDAVAWDRNDHAGFGDAQGRLSLTIPATEMPTSLSLVAPDYLLWSRRRISAPLPGQPAMIVGLHSAAVLSGRVIDQNGQPLGGVELQLTAKVDRHEAGYYRWRSAGRQSISGPEGDFTISPLPAGAPLDLVVSKPGYASTRLELDPLAPRRLRSGLEVILSAGRDAFGTVVDEAGSPVRGAIVELRRWQGTAENSRWQRRDARTPFEATAVTDELGRFELADLGAGVFDLEVRAAGFAAARVPGIELGEGKGELDVGEIGLQRGLRIVGQVVDEDGQPVAKAKVNIGPPGTQSHSSRDPLTNALSDSSGRFEFRNRAADAYQLRVVAPGFQPTQSGRLEAPVEMPIRLVLRRGATVSGRVVDRQGVAVADARIYASRRGGEHHGVRATSAADGRFELSGLGFAEYRLTFRKPKYEPDEVQIQVLPDTDLEPIEVVLARGAIVAGRVSWPDGRPAGGISVYVRPTEANGSDSEGGRTDSSGQFEIDRAPMGPAVVVAKVGIVESREEVDVQPGLNSVSLTLPAGVEVSGWVSDEAGLPVPAARVTLRPALRSGFAGALTGDDGRFVLRDVVPGSYRLEVMHPQYADYRAEANFEVGAEPVAGLEASLRRGAVVSGRLEGLDLDTLAAVRVRLRGRSGSRYVTPDYAGRFRFEQVLPGDYSAEAKLDQRVLATGEFELAPAVEELEIELRPVTGFELRGRVLRGGRGVGNVRVHAISAGARSAVAFTTAEGAFVVHDLAEGPQQLTVRAPGGQDHRRQIEVREGREVLIELPDGEVSGRVYDADSGNPLAGAKVELLILAEPGSPTARRPGESVVQVRSDSMGVFVLRGVESGRYRLNVQLDGYGWQMAELEVLEEPLRGIELGLSPTGGLKLRVVRDDGAPLGWMRAALFDQQGRLALVKNIQLDAEGRGHFDPAPSGSWKLWMSSGTSAWAVQDVQVPGAEVPVVLTNGAAVSFTVPELGDDLEDLTVIVRDASGRPLPDLSRFFAEVLWYDGAGFVSNLWPGQWTLYVRHPDGRSWQATFVARVGQLNKLELR